MKTNQTTIRIQDKELMAYYRTKKNKSLYIRNLIMDEMTLYKNTIKTKLDKVD